MEVKIPQAVRLSLPRQRWGIDEHVPQAVKLFRAEAKPQPQAPPQPATFKGSDIEWWVYWWLTRRFGPEGTLWFFQTPFLGGRKYLGGQVADFVVEDRTPPLVIGVQGEYWHYGTSEKRATAVLAKLNLQAIGLTVVYVRGLDLKRALNATMEAALEGRQLYLD